MGAASQQVEIGRDPHAARGRPTTMDPAYLVGRQCRRLSGLGGPREAFFSDVGGHSGIEIVDAYTPGGGGNDGQTYDWAFNLIAEARLTDFATTAWAPGGLDLIAPAGPDVNGNPIWVTPSGNTTIYVKYDGKVSGNTGLLSPCGLRYDVAIPLNALNYTKIRDASDNDQSGIAVYTCNGVVILSLISFQVIT